MSSTSYAQKYLGKYHSYGTLRHSIIEGNFKLIAEVDSGIVDVARALLPKSIRLNRQRYAPHISIVRNEVPKNLKFWGPYEGMEQMFFYDMIVKNDETYYWLNVYCPFFHSLRIDLGLAPSSEWSRPPDGSDNFHITIGNTKILT